MNWQDRWTVPIAAMALAGLLLWVYVLEPISVPPLGAFTPIPVAAPFAVFVHPKLRDPFLLANEWDAVLVNRDRLLRDRTLAAEAARDEEEQRNLEREDEEYFKRTGRHLAKWKPRPKLKVPLPSTPSSKPRARVPAPPPPPPAFVVGGIMIGGTHRTAVVNDRVVAEGDTIQGFKITHLDPLTIELMGVTDPWKGKRLRMDVAPAPAGLTYVRASRFAGPPRPGVLVIPPMVGEPLKPTPSPNALPPK